MPPSTAFSESESESEVILGQLLHSSQPIAINVGRASVVVSVTNTADRPIQVGSHYHFIETNPYLRFNRRLSYGKRLNIPAGTSVRFEPGETKSVSLVEIAGSKVIRGGNNLCDGPVSTQPAVVDALISSLVGKGFLHIEDASNEAESAPKKRRVDDSTGSTSLGILTACFDYQSFAFLTSITFNNILRLKKLTRLFLHLIFFQIL